MRVAGVEVEKSEDIVYGPLVFSRGFDEDGEEILLPFYTQPVWEFDDFNKACPVPPCDFYLYNKGVKKKDYDHSGYKDLIAIHDRKRWGWFTLKALEPSELTLKTANLDDPETWHLVEAELRKGLAEHEFNQLMRLVDSANNLDARKLQANVTTFLQRQARRTEETSQSGGPENTNSSEPA